MWDCCRPTSYSCFSGYDVLLVHNSGNLHIFWEPGLDFCQILQFLCRTYHAHKRIFIVFVFFSVLGLDGGQFGTVSVDALLQYVSNCCANRLLLLSVRPISCPAQRKELLIGRWTELYAPRFLSALHRRATERHMPYGSIHTRLSCLNPSHADTPDVLIREG